MSRTCIAWPSSFATGEGELAVERFVANHSSRLKARVKVQQSRYRNSPLDRVEGVRIVEDWVETAMRLSPEEQRAMDMLILMQAREASSARRRRSMARRLARSIVSTTRRLMSEISMG